MAPTFPLLALLLSTATTLVTADLLSQALSAVPFTHTLSGVSLNNDQYGSHALPCYYLEIENVTHFAGSWGGACAVKTMQVGPVPPTQCTSQSPPHEGFDRPGEDLSTNVVALPADCSNLCCSTSNCLAWTYVTKLISGTEGECSAGKPCCWLKGSVPAESPLNYPGGIYSGTVDRPPPAPIQVPPTGVRNAVPVGGLGAGTLELRGDGTVHELTIHSASPAGSAKYATQDDILFAYRVGGGTARSIRTAPPAYASPGLASITYSGVYPVSQLNLSDPTLTTAGLTDVSLFAYHHLVPGDSPTSSNPAVTFTLTATNTGSTPTTLAFYFQIPFGAMANCQRLGVAYSTPATLTYAACLSACAANATGCGAWNYDSTSGVCALLPSAQGMVYSGGETWCGVAGAGWSTLGEDGATLTLALNATPSSAGSAAIGDISVRGVGDSPSATSSSVSLGVSSDPSALYASFSSTGGFPTQGSVVGGPFANTQAGCGAVIVTATIPPGATVSQSVVLGWYFPNRDYYGKNVGQFYSTRFASSTEVVALYDTAHLLDVVGDAVQHTSVWAGEGVSHPSWLSDHMVNQFSHFRNFIYSRDGLMREHEANDCPVSVCGGLGGKWGGKGVGAIYDFPPFLSLHPLRSFFNIAPTNTHLYTHPHYLSFSIYATGS